MSIKWRRRWVCVYAGLSLGNAMAAFPDARYYRSFSHWPLVVALAGVACLVCALVGIGMAAPGEHGFRFGSWLFTAVVTAIGASPLYLDGLRPPPELIVFLTVGTVIATLWCRHRRERKPSSAEWWS